MPLTIKGDLGRISAVPWGQTLLNKAGHDTAVTFLPMAEAKHLPFVIPHPGEPRRAEALEEDIPPALLAGAQGEAV